MPHHLSHRRATTVSTFLSLNDVRISTVQLVRSSLKESHTASSCVVVVVVANDMNAVVDLLSKRPGWMTVK